MSQLGRTLAAMGLASVLAAGTSVGHAATFDFSYAFNNDSFAPTGDVISGSFTGTLTGSDVTDIANVTASFYDGSTTVALSGPLTVYSYTPSAEHCNSYSCFTLGGAVASFNPAHNNFFFIDSAAANFAGYTNYFYVIQPWSNSGPGDETIAVQYLNNNTGTLIENYNGLYAPGNWTLTEVPVPEPATWAMMLIGLGALGASLRLSRRRFAAVPNAA